MVVLLALCRLSGRVGAAVVLVTLLGLVGLTANPVLVGLAVRFGGSAPTLASAPSTSAFDFGNAVGTRGRTQGRPRVGVRLVRRLERPYLQADGTAEVLDLPVALDRLVEYFRVISGEHPGRDNYREARARRICPPRPGTAPATASRRTRWTWDRGCGTTWGIRQLLERDRAHHRLDHHEHRSSPA
ncbi:hypothetical protein [Amycolatopsis thermophila]|uniref:Uncharacterized protein n=1 Tax=Amycolatopsis thermophila TaxID=206084 RepID=A0ABU0F4E3_9PSEU|nr:hypothetical protein [Amycolatopsis thermophila]MDQ0382460.1 hypothetical protein [Amycolatopsis thermophila]